MSNPHHKNEQLSMNLDNPGETVYDSGNWVNIGQRALLLTTALEEFSNHSKSGGFKKALHTPHREKIQDRYDPQQIRDISAGGQSSLDRAEAAFSKAFSADKMVAAGEDPIMADYERKWASNAFINRYIGPESKNARARIRRTLARQTKMFKL